MYRLSLFYGVDNQWQLGVWRCQQIRPNACKIQRQAETDQWCHSHPHMWCCPSRHGIKQPQTLGRILHWQINLCLHVHVPSWKYSTRFCPCTASLWSGKILMLFRESVRIFAYQTSLVHFSQLFPVSSSPPFYFLEGVLKEVFLCKRFNKVKIAWTVLDLPVPGGPMRIVTTRQADCCSARTCWELSCWSALISS